MASDSDWLFESVQQYLHSPAWALPVMSFIDENCIVFDSDEENKLAYMEIYQAFKDMVDSLLEFQLSDMGVSQDQFFNAIATNPEATLSKQMLEQLLVIDDFVSFKKMMVKRNAELEAEALGMIKKYQEAAAQDAEAPKEAGAVAHGAMDTGAVVSDVGMDQGGAGDRDGAGKQDDFEAQLQRAMKLSMEEAIADGPLDEADVEALRRRQEEAELEMVLAMSLQLVDTKNGPTPSGPDDQALKEALAASAAEEEARHKAAQEAAEAEAKAINESKRAAEAEAAKLTATTAMGAGSPKGPLPPPAAPPPPTGSLPEAPAPSNLVGSIKEARQAAADAAATDATLEPASVLPAQSPAARAVAALGTQSQAHQSVFIADPKKATESQLANLKRAEEAARRAEQARKRAQAQALMSPGAAVPAPMPQPAAPSGTPMRMPAAGVAASVARPEGKDEELEVKRRAEHMRRQRELLLIQKRNQALASVQATTAAGYSSGDRKPGANVAGNADAPSSLSASVAKQKETHDFLASQRKELESRLNKTDEATKEEVQRIQQERQKQQNLNAMLLKPLM